VSYRPTPPEYKLLYRDQYYEEMASNSLILEKQGVFFDRFRREEPQPMSFRTEYRGDVAFDDIPAFKSLLQYQYEKCGWALIFQNKDRLVFCGPYGSIAPNIQDHEKRLIEKINSKKGSCWVEIISATLLLVAIYFDFKLSFLLMQFDLLFSGMIVSLLFKIYKGIRGLIRIHRQKAQVTNLGLSELPSVQKRHPIQRMISAMISIFIFCSIVGAGIEYLLIQTDPLPGTAAQKPYLLCEEVFSGQRDSSHSWKDYNQVQYTPTLLAPTQYHVDESYTTADGTSVYLKQSTYTTWNHEMAIQMAYFLTRQSFFYDSSDFQPVAIVGLDLALIVPNGMDLIAVKGNTVVSCSVMISCNKTKSDDTYQLYPLLNAYVQKLSS
jgi:hypothetical protein